MTLEEIPAGGADADSARLTELVAVIQRTQRSEDVEGFLALFTADAVWVTGAGHRLVGLDRISAFTRESLPGGMTGQSVRYDVLEVRFPASDIAVTSVDQEYLTADEQSFSPRRQGKPTYVWVRTDGDWRIVQGQNTVVLQPGSEPRGEHPPTRRPLPHRHP